MSRVSRRLSGDLLAGGPTGPLLSGEMAGAAMAMMPVVRRHPESGEIIQADLRWGLIPHYENTRPDIQPIHARSESITDKRMFQDAYRRRRCVVPMSAFFQKDENGKPHAFGMKDGALFGVAGIWENWRDPESGEWERTFAMVTVEANALVAPVKDRMPAILRPEDFLRWFGGEPDPRDLLRPFAAELMAERPFRRR